MASSSHWITAVTPQDKRFYQALGQRVAELRKAQDLTQVQLAERLGVSQQTLAHYEVGRLRIAVAMLPALAKELAVSVETLVGTPTIRNKRGPAPKLQRQIEQIQQLPRTKQRFVIEMLDTVLQQSD
ncbi:helix-turn-helix domain-containing protein [Woeseia oceani]|nr:helix-turn-helix transcriptional regulator [Woeseia oceani]